MTATASTRRGEPGEKSYTAVDGQNNSKDNYDVIVEATISYEIKLQKRTKSSTPLFRVTFVQLKSLRTYSSRTNSAMQPGTRPVYR